MSILGTSTTPLLLLPCFFIQSQVNNKHRLPWEPGITFFSSSQPHPGSHRTLFNLSPAGSHLASLASALVRPSSSLTWATSKSLLAPCLLEAVKHVERAQALKSESPGLNSRLHQAAAGQALWASISSPFINPTGRCEDLQREPVKFLANAVLPPTFPAQSTLPEYCNIQLSLSICGKGGLVPGPP